MIGLITGRIDGLTSQRRFLRKLVVHPNTDTCKKGLHPWVPSNIIRRPSDPKGECRECARISRNNRATTGSTQ